MSGYKWLNDKHEMYEFFKGLLKPGNVLVDSDYDGYYAMLVDSETGDVVMDFGAGFSECDRLEGEEPSDQHKKIILDALNASVDEVVGFDIEDHQFSDKDVTVIDSTIDKVNCLTDNGLYADVFFSLNKADAIAIAKHFKLTGEDLK